MGDAEAEGLTRLPSKTAGDSGVPWNDYHRKPGS
jgi:hypothetical protein